MSKKSDRDETKDEEKDLEEEEGEEGDEETDEEEEQERVAAAKAQPRARASRPRREAHDDHGHGHGHEEEEAGDEDEDPYWWGPHAVMSVLILVGILGFFGALNKPLAFLPNVFDRAFGSFVPKGAPHKDGHAAAAHDDKHAEPAKPTPPGPQPTRPGAEQGTREMFGAKHLLVMYKGSRRAPPTVSRTKEEALARANEAAKKAKADKNKFADFVKEYSDEPGAATRGGDLGRFPKGQMVPEFQNALEKIKVGDVSDVVESPFGYHVILRTQ